MCQALLYSMSALLAAEYVHLPAQAWHTWLPYLPPFQCGYQSISQCTDAMELPPNSLELFQKISRKLSLIGPAMKKLLSTCRRVFIRSMYYKMGTYIVYITKLLVLIYLNIVVLYLWKNINECKTSVWVHSSWMKRYLKWWYEGLEIDG